MPKNNGKSLKLTSIEIELKWKSKKKTKLKSEFLKMNNPSIEMECLNF
jgi:hypothetical protein